MSEQRSSDEVAASPPLPTTDDFSDLVGRLLMHMEELRSKIKQQQSNNNNNNNKNATVMTAEQVVAWQQDLEDLLPLLDTLNRRTLDVADPESIESAMFQSCQTKATQLAQVVLETCVAQYHEPTGMIMDNNNNNNNMDNNAESSSEHDELGTTPAERQALLQEAQGAMARLTELNLILLVATTTTTTAHGSNNRQQQEQEQQDLDRIIQQYVQYQRFVIRQRAKPAVARLVESRRKQQQQQQQQSTGNSLLARATIHHHHDDDNDDDDDDDNEEKAVTVVEQHYAPVLVHILGQAAALIHPLLVWQGQLPLPEETNNNNNVLVESIRRLCLQTISILDEQTQALVKTVSDWFWQDAPVDAYLQESLEATAHDDNESSTCTTQGTMNAMQLGALDGLVEEMGFASHVQARYVDLVAVVPATSQDVVAKDDANTNGNGTAIASSLSSPLSLAQTIEKELLPEWTWKYASLERYLAVKQWQAALAVCQPVQIVIGMPIQVPSVVEDAQFLSTRALERSATTKSAVAMGTVAHAVSHDIWSTDAGVGTSVYQALLDQRGCWTNNSNSQRNDDSHQINSNNSNSSKQKMDFASALMDALDDDMVQAAASTKKTASSSLGARPPSAPSSGGFLGLSLGDNEAVLQMQLDVAFCVMNGAHASAAACRALVEYLDSLLSSEDALDTRGGSGDRSTAMVELAREELYRYAGDYEKFLQSQINAALSGFAGGTRAPRSRLALDRIYDFFANENYDIDVKEMKATEDDDRLARELDHHFASSMFLRQISQKCESHVMHLIGEELVEALTLLVPEALFIPERKVTDWGALLFSKEVRRLQNLVANALTSEHADQPAVFAWARLSQIVTVLQLESPSEWTLYRSSKSVLTTSELERTMALRADFSPDAIRTVLASMNGTS